MTDKFQFIPSLFTSLNFFFGFFSIAKTVEGNLHAAAWFIILAILCDGLDGKLARWTHNETPFGFELDSLGDLVSSGLAPALLLYAGGLYHFHFLGFVICFLYLFAGGYRLARFNVLQAGDRSKGYVGLPIPIAGMTVSAFWLFKSSFFQNLAYGWWIFLILFLTFLMVSLIQYDWPKLLFHGSWKNRIQSGGLLIALGMMVLFPRHSLFPLFLLYIFLGIGNWFKKVLRGETSFIEIFLRTAKQ